MMSTAGIWKKIVGGVTAIGRAIPAAPRTARRLNTFEPRIFPIAISDSFLRAACIDAASSGTDVPKATMVAPITISGILTALARSTPPFTSIAAPAERAASPTMTNRMLGSSFGFRSFSSFSPCSSSSSSAASMTCGSDFPLL